MNNGQEFTRGSPVNQGLGQWLGRQVKGIEQC